MMAADSLVRRSSARSRRAAFLAAAVILVATALVPAQVTLYDVVITNARVVDGTGSPWFRAHIGIRGDVIATIATNIDAPSTRIINATGLVVAPGFIDLHVHALQGAGPPLCRREDGAA